MKTNYLFPNSFRMIGWVLLIPAIVLGYMVLFENLEFSFLNVKTLSLLPDSLFGATSNTNSLWSIVDDNFTQEFVGILFIVSAIFVAFSKEKNEDEYIYKIRLESLVWATYLSFAIQILCILFFYDFTFLKSMMINTVTILIVFIVRYNFIIYRSKFQKDEE
jgi:hypothetical protein